MSLHRFILPPTELADDTVFLTGDHHHHASRVLRLKPGSEIILCDGQGREWVATIREIERTRTSVEKVAPVTPIMEGGLSITVYQGLPKGDKLDLVLQKSTELGVAAITPFIAQRTVSRPSPQQHEGRVARWEKIVREASRQSRRPTVPVISLASGVEALLATSDQEVKLLLWEEEHGTHLRDVLASHEKPGSIAVLVGPEGGLTAHEAELAKKRGFIPVTIGGRILRTETAAIAAVTILQFYWGDLG